jgi:hypothetical protein
MVKIKFLPASAIKMVDILKIIWYFFAELGEALGSRNN